MDSGSGSYESESESEEGPPLLKYTRLGASILEIAKRDTTSCAAVLGSNLGCIYILDLFGHEIHRFLNHGAPVISLTIDERGEFIGSCSEDGKVVISSLYEFSSETFDYSDPVFSIALSPDYVKTKEFICGLHSGKVVHHTKGWWSDNDELIHSGEGPIHALAWGNGDFVIWANDIGVKIYDFKNKMSIGSIQRPTNSPHPERYKCRLFWESKSQFIIAWGNDIKIVQLRFSSTPVEPGMSPFVPVIITHLTTESFLSGVAPFGQDLVVLSFSQDGESGEAKRPEFYIITKENEDVSVEALGVTGFQYLTANDYHLCPLPQEKMYFLVTPKEIIVAKTCDKFDFIEWLMQRKDYISVINTIGTGWENYAHLKGIPRLGQLYLDSIKKEGEFSMKGEPEDIISTWEKWIQHFAKIDKLNLLQPYVPIASPYLLSRRYYEIVLEGLLKTKQHHDLFIHSLKTWPKDFWSSEFLFETLRREGLEDNLKKELQEILNTRLAQRKTSRPEPTQTKAEVVVKELPSQSIIVPDQQKEEPKENPKPTEIPKKDPALIETQKQDTTTPPEKAEDTTEPTEKAETEDTVTPAEKTEDQPPMKEEKEDQDEPLKQEESKKESDTKDDTELKSDSLVQDDTGPSQEHTGLEQDDTKLNDQ